MEREPVSPRLPARRAGAALLWLAAALAVVWAASRLEGASLLRPSGDPRRGHLTFSNQSAAAADAWRSADGRWALPAPELRALAILGHDADVFALAHPARGWTGAAAFSRVYLSPLDPKWIDLFSLGVLAPRPAALEVSGGPFASPAELERAFAAAGAAVGWTLFFDGDAGSWIVGFVALNACACLAGAAALWLSGRRRVRAAVLRGAYRRHRRSLLASRELARVISRHEGLEVPLSGAAVAGVTSESFVLTPRDFSAGEPAPRAAGPEAAVFGRQQRARRRLHDSHRARQRAFELQVAAEGGHLLGLFAGLDQLALGPHRTLEELCADGGGHWGFCAASVSLHWAAVAAGGGWMVLLLGLPVHDVLYAPARAAATAYVSVAAASMLAHHAWTGAPPARGWRRAALLCFPAWLFPASAYLSLASAVHLALWFSLGLLLRPEVCVPVVVNGLVVAFYVASTHRRLRRRKRTLRRRAREHQLLNGCAHLHPAGEMVPGTAAGELVGTICGGVLFLACAILFVTLGFFAFGSDRVDDVYYTVFLSAGPAVAGAGARLFQTEADPEPETEPSGRLCARHVRFPVEA